MKIDQNGQTRFRLHPDKGAIQVPDNYICSITMHASKGEANSQIHRISSCISAIRTLPGSTARQQVSDFGMRAADLRWTHTDGLRVSDHNFTSIMIDKPVARMERSEIRE